MGVDEQTIAADEHHKHDRKPKKRTERGGRAKLSILKKASVAATV